jgi:hypothetical protein
MLDSSRRASQFLSISSSAISSSHILGLFASAIPIAANRSLSGPRGGRSADETLGLPMGVYLERCAGIRKSIAAFSVLNRATAAKTS